MQIISDEMHSDTIAIRLIKYNLKNGKLFRLPAKNDPVPPPPRNFADIVYLKEQSFLHRIRDVCTLLVGA